MMTTMPAETDPTSLIGLVTRWLSRWSASLRRKPAAVDAEEMMERRRGERRGEARFKDGASTAVTVVGTLNTLNTWAKIVDATESGLRISCTLPLRSGEVIRCAVPFGAGKTRNVTMRVMWARHISQAFEYGVTCVDNDSPRILQQYVLCRLSGSDQPVTCRRRAA